MAKIRKPISLRKSKKLIKKNSKSFIKYYKTRNLFKRNRANKKNNWLIRKSDNLYLENEFYKINNFEENEMTINNTPSNLEQVNDKRLQLLQSDCQSPIVLPLSSPQSLLKKWDWRNPKAPEKWKNIIIEKNKGAKPYLGRNDLDLLFNYLLVESPCNKLRLLWNKAAASNQTEEFLCAFAKVLSRSSRKDESNNDEIKNRSIQSYEKVNKLRIVRTHENGNKYVTSLANGFITTVFDVDI